MSRSAHSAQPNVSETFGPFFNEWFDQKQLLLEQLLLAVKTSDGGDGPNLEQQKNVMERVMNHYKHFNEMKSNAAKADVFLFFSPPWLTAFERALLWFGEFKPTMLFSLLNRSVRDLTAEQRERIEQVKAASRREEKELTQKMATIQENVASLSILNFVRRFNETPLDGEAPEMDEVMDALKTAMLKVLERADLIRGSTAEKVVEVLSPMQTVRFLAAAVEFQLRVQQVMKWGSLESEVICAYGNREALEPSRLITKLSKRRIFPQ